MPLLVAITYYQMKTEDIETLDSLRQESYIIHLLYHRNKNQHKNSLWWKHLHILKRVVSKVLELELLPNKSEFQWRSLHSLLRRLTLKQRNKVYYDFNTLIAQGQFLTLGVVLLAAFARVHSVFIRLLVAHSRDFEVFDQPPTNVKFATHTVEQLINEELGEEIIQTTGGLVLPKSFTDSRDLTTVDHITARRTRKKQKKQKKSAIDNIFG